MTHSIIICYNAQKALKPGQPAGYFLTKEGFSMDFGIPQLIYLALTFIGLGITFNSWGEPIDRNHGWLDIIAIMIVYALLIWGGFFG